MKKIDMTPDEILSALRQDMTTDSKKVEEQYDAVAETYDEAVRNWQYQAPEI